MQYIYTVSVHDLQEQVISQNFLLGGGSNYLCIREVRYSPSRRFGLTIHFPKFLEGEE